MKLFKHNGCFKWNFLLFLALTACGPNINHYAKLNEHLLVQDYEAALADQRDSRKDYSSRDKVLYYLDEGLLAHFAGHYDESNLALTKAEKIMADLYTLSISKQAASFLINDNATDYRGEDFEAALVNLFMALNYVELGQLDEALVEARKVDSKLISFNLQYPSGEKNVYDEDAFIRYLMGVLYMADGEINDAFISFRKAEHIYRKDYLPNYGIAPPRVLIENLLWTAQKMGFTDEYDRYRKAYPKIVRQMEKWDSNEALISFIHYNGRGAEKVERNFFVPMPDGYVLKLAYPEFQKRPFRVNHVQISLTNLQSKKLYQFSSQVMEDISAIARLNLKNRIGRITAKAVARVTAKYLLAKEAEKKALKDGDKDLAKIIRITFQTYMVAFEVADIRHWRLLPAQIQVGRGRVPPGNYVGSIQLLDHNGAVIANRPVSQFTLKPGETKLVTFRTLE